LVFEGGDDGQQVGLHSAVHLRHAVLPGCLGGDDELAGVCQLLVVLGEELGGGDEQRAG
jgi:hypothetical protein